MLDASALVRGTLGEVDSAAAAWIEAVARREVEGFSPELVFAEVANAVAVAARAGRLAADDARRALDLVLELRLQVVSLRELAAPALAAALERGLTAYDACYLVLAEAAGAILVTADARLAETAGASALLPGAGPPGR